MALRRNILIFHSGALGDFLLTWPLSLAIGRVMAQSRVFYVTSRQKGQLAEKVLRVESADAEAGWHHLFSELPTLPDVPARLLAGAQVIFNLVSDANSAWTRNVARIAPDAQLITVSTVAPDDFTGHQTDYLLQQLQPHPVFAHGMQQMLRSIEQRGITPWPIGETPVIHPGSGGRAKCWPIERFIDLATELERRGKKPRILIGEVEQERWGVNEIERLAAVGDLQRPADLLGLASALAGASVFIGNDSGPGHLAGLLGIPTISLFGPTDPVRWKPLGPKVRVLRGQPIESIAVSDVLKVVG